MNVFLELKKRGIKLKKSDIFFKGYYTTAVGKVISIDSNKCDRDKKIYFLEDKNRNIIPCYETKITFVTGTEYEGMGTNEIKQLEKEGKLFSASSLELYREYYELDKDEDLMCCLKYGYSAQSRKYIESIMNEIGLIDLNAKEELITFQNPEIVRFYFNASTEIGRLDDNLWVAQTCFRYVIDDFGIIKMYFNHKPNNKEIKTAFGIDHFQSSPHEVFTCKECGQLKNWIDIPGNIIVKYAYSEARYCGCEKRIGLM